MSVLAALVGAATMVASPAVGRVGHDIDLASITGLGVAIAKAAFATPYRATAPTSALGMRQRRAHRIAAPAVVWIGEQVRLATRRAITVAVTEVLVANVDGAVRERIATGYGVVDCAGVAGIGAATMGWLVRGHTTAAARFKAAATGPRRRRDGAATEVGKATRTPQHGAAAEDQENGEEDGQKNGHAHRGADPGGRGVVLFSRGHASEPASERENARAGPPDRPRLSPPSAVRVAP
ncbi:MAG TPA: hypothetical protein VGP07_11155 [Polyangia bacterium]